MQDRNPPKYLIILFAVCGRLIPHLWNMTPTLSLSLLSGRLFKTWQAITLTLFGMLVSDALLAILQHHAILGSWSLFTYSALLITTLAARYFSHNSWRSRIVLLLSSSLFFWLWTNFGCWLQMPLYPKNLFGLLQCYSAALPFLQHQLLGDAVWFSALSCGYHYLKKRTFAMT